MLVNRGRRLVRLGISQAAVYSTDWRGEAQLEETHMERVTVAHAGE